jgi:membrane protease YdiL (CAAX protease family)
MLAIEFVDTLLVLFAVFWVSRPPALPKRSFESRAASWLGAVPMLLLLLGLNLGYHFWLKKILALPVWFEGMREKEDFSAWNILATCAQPAIIEELFFRYLALGTLRRFMNTPGAVAVSSVMFGIAHIGVPLSIPMLTVVGFGLGYLRVTSGGLALPMLMHFAHNFVILLLNSLL